MTHVYAVRTTDGIRQFDGLAAARRFAMTLPGASSEDVSDGAYGVPVTRDGRTIGTVTHMPDGAPAWLTFAPSGVCGLADLRPNGSVVTYGEGRAVYEAGGRWFPDMPSLVRYASEHGWEGAHVTRIKDGRRHGDLFREVMPSLDRRTLEIGPQTEMWFFVRYDGAMCSYLSDGTMDMTYQEHARIRQVAHSKDSARDFVMRHSMDMDGEALFDSYLSACGFPPEQGCDGHDERT